MELNLKSINNSSKNKFNLIKSKDFVKQNIFKNIEKSKKIVETNKILKPSHKKIDSKSKFNISDYLLSFINRMNTESNGTATNFQKNKGNK